MFNYYLVTTQNNSRLIYKHNLFNNNIQYFNNYAWEYSTRYEITPDMVKLN